MCERVVVLSAGGVCFEGTPTELAQRGEGRVWHDDRPDDAALRSWRTADGRYRMIGDPPPGADLATPGIEDGYLLLTSEPIGSLR
jgi:ABC-2 type transport system ATP-binding protein